MKYPLFLRAYNSPFRPPKLKWYFGHTAIGTPIFLPRKWVKFTFEDAVKSAEEFVKKHPKSLEKISFDKLVESRRNYFKAVPLKIGFNFCDLMWKTKWQRDDYRFEYSPMISFVFFGYQIAITFVAIEALHYWECFLPYYFETDKRLSVKERIEYCRKRYPCIWTSYRDGDEEITDYWNIVLKNKFL